MGESCKPFFVTSVPSDNSQILDSEIIDGIGEDCVNPVFLGHDTDPSQLHSLVEEEVEEDGQDEEDVTEEENDVGYSEDAEYKIKYRKVKAEFRRSVETHEFLKNELKHHQLQLKTLHEDKFFLLERMLQYEKPPESPESNDGSDSDHEPGGARKKVKPNPGGVTISSAFSKMKSFSAGRRSRKTKLKCVEDVFESPNDSMGTFEDESSGLGTAGFSFSTQDESD
ncbi:uncharacterized protein LOC111703267 [Eurytemora carolleeae]|uniref:uncharacterized protein LOC111703267 n=1 Tax=Eurytemora carolleeae TaxID=1294199 RepID=UPI000C7711E6|nr:uncharacterized protein LOC111703267 [Eurytemora carolleeae]|eukprot:XP_023330927.1 uncharacterized protein LOC111703267 [Eurytemora affinis]